MPRKIGLFISPWKTRTLAALSEFTQYPRWVLAAWREPRRW